MFLGHKLVFMETLIPLGIHRIIIEVSRVSRKMRIHS